MSDFLAGMMASSQARVDAALGVSLLPIGAPVLRLDSDFDLIAEIKPHSPAEGSLSSQLSIEARCDAYARGGAAAVSVLTEPTRFGGSLDLLERAARRLRPHGIPVMRKDFLVHPIQIDEAAAVGAGGVLLILAMLSPEKRLQMLDRAQELGLFVLLEAFDAAELETAAALARERKSTVLVGLNCRNLSSLRVEPERFISLAERLPPGLRCVAESGLERASDISRVSQLGYSLALVGSALMRSPDPAEELEQMVAQGRASAGLPRVKICGLQTPEAVDVAVAAGADALGFVLVESPRRVDPEQAHSLSANLPPGVSSVGVFQTIDARAVDIALEAGMDRVQGHPTAQGIQRARERGIGCLSALNDGPRLSEELASVAGPVLVDGPRSGSGESADLARVAHLAARRPLVLAGGLSPENVEATVARVRPAGVDVSSGVERSRGVKDLERIEHFVRIARSALDEAARAAGGER
jgi:indole-3-glycerol phosphate synthase/phosphoribosylanthranilate isomerase/anthranilate synthase/indole-3-glycerol phosphate synthase/phosphoribosylanthranilate isomerase